MKHRLSKLETAVRGRRGRPCPLCHGEPWAEVFKVYDWRDGGHGTAPDRYLSDDYAARITDDLCCRRCGTPVPANRLVVQMLLKGVSWPLPSGRGGRPLPRQI